MHADTTIGLKCSWYYVPGIMCTRVSEYQNQARWGWVVGRKNTCLLRTGTGYWCSYEYRCVPTLHAVHTRYECFIYEERYKTCCNRLRPDAHHHQVLRYSYISKSILLRSTQRSAEEATAAAEVLPQTNRSPPTRGTSDTKQASLYCYPYCTATKQSTITLHHGEG